MTTAIFLLKVLIMTLLKITSENIQEEEEEESNEMASQLPEALDILRRLHLFASKKQPALHSLISDFEPKMTGLYLDSKVRKQSYITDYFK